MNLYDYDLEESDDDLTPISCSVCGGEYRRENCKTGKSGEYRISECRWCTMGCMTETQRRTWLQWSKLQREKQAANG